MPVRDLLSAASGVGGASDPYFYANSLLLNGDGTNGAQNNTFLDSSTNNFTITRNGNTTQGSFSPYGTLWSNYFNASNSCYLNTATNGTAFAMGTGDYTIEGWACKTSTTDDEGIFGTEATGIRLYWYSGNLTHQCGLNSGGGSGVSVSETVPSLNTWFHWACVRSSGTIRLYINGVSTTSTGSATANITSTYMTIGRELVNYASYYWDGYISNVRAVKGTAVYTSNFTPSTTPLTAISGTSLLTCQSNRFIDNSSNAFAITTTGTPSVQRFSPFNPTAPYSTSVIGGSGYFSATSGDNISAASTSLTFSSGNYTIEAWVYVTAYATTANTILLNASSGAASAYFPRLSFTSTVIQTYDVASNNLLTFSGTVPLNAWTHVALSKSGTSVRAFINGIQAGSTATDSYTWSNGGQPNNIGGVSGTANFQLKGYMTDLCVNNTTALYTTNFTPPTAPETAVSGTQLLLNYVNAGIPDLAMQNNLETVGDAQVSTSVKKYGTGSLAFDGTGDWLSIPNTPNLQLNAGAFTIECWINFSSLASNRGIMYFGTNPNSNFAYGLQWAGNALYFWYTTTGSNLASVSASWTPSTSIWYFLAVTRSGNDLKFFINGTQIGTTQSLSGVTIFNSTDVIRIGGEATGSPTSLPGTMNGYIDDFRITNGYARYTANFTPPTSALPTY